MQKVVVIAPHPDDESLGCGGALLKHASQGDEIHWVIITEMKAERGFASERIEERAQEIERVSALYGFASVHCLGFAAGTLSSSHVGEIVSSLGAIFTKLEPQVVYIPYRGDIHTDHAIVFDATASCTKWFRYPSINRVLVYETLSETDFGIDPDANAFRPNVFIDISHFLTGKLEAISIFKSEFMPFPFPRSEEAVVALAKVRGAASGFMAAEAFMLVKERC